MTMDVGVPARLGDKVSGPLRGVTASVTASAQRMNAPTTEAQRAANRAAMACQLR